MRVSIFVGDLADAEADAVCTSTNPRLSLVMGTGSAIRERGGFEILRACEEIIRAHRSEWLPPGTAYVTTAGNLPHKIAIHCVASDISVTSAAGIVGVLRLRGRGHHGSASMRRGRDPDVL